MIDMHALLMHIWYTLCHGITKTIIFSCLMFNNRWGEGRGDLGHKNTAIDLFTSNVKAWIAQMSWLIPSSYSDGFISLISISIISTVFCIQFCTTTKKIEKKSQILLIHRFMFNIYKSTFPAKNTQIWQNNSLDPFFVFDWTICT